MDNFDEQVVLTGNRHCKEYKDVNENKRQKEVIEDIDCYELYPEYTSEEVNAKLKELYDKCRCTEDTMIDVLAVALSRRCFKDGTIRGYCQGGLARLYCQGDVDTDLI